MREDRQKDVKGETVAILGGGVSGVGSALLAKAKGMSPFVSDSGKLSAEARTTLTGEGIPFEEGGHDMERIVEAKHIVKSPGIADSTPIMRLLNSKGRLTESELEFAKPFSRGKVIAITGSNGKTTTSTLTHYILQRAGLDVALCGNIEKSYAEQVARGDHDWYVLEVSSFQLDNMYAFRADIAVLLNITPDHLDRYGLPQGSTDKGEVAQAFQHYTDSKLRIIQNQRHQDSLVYWKGDERIEAELLKRLTRGYAPTPTPSSRPARQGRPTLRPFTDNDFAHLGLTFPLPGQHNKRNALAAFMATRLAGVEESIVRQCLRDFPGVEHRLEKVIEERGILWVNDSKATNVDACRTALLAMERPTVLILGGLDKGNDYEAILPLIKKRCKGLVFLGLDNSKLHAALDKASLPTEDTHSMADCVEACRRLAVEGDVVLLSPACASFDLFRNMEDRGEQFKALVREGVVKGKG